MTMGSAVRLSIVALTGMLSVGILSGGPLAIAQERPSPPSRDPGRTQTDDCRPAPAPGGPGQSQNEQGARGDDPGQTLSRSGGVICPPTGVDPSIQKPAPEEGRTPVIPPPGTPGNDSPVKPK
jgi:hypothetical protein